MMRLRDDEHFGVYTEEVACVCGMTEHDHELRVLLPVTMISRAEAFARCVQFWPWPLSWVIA